MHGMNDSLVRYPLLHNKLIEQLCYSLRGINRDLANRCTACIYLLMFNYILLSIRHGVYLSLSEGHTMPIGTQCLCPRFGLS